MAILVVTYDTATGGFRTQKLGSAQISDGAIVSGKVAAEAIGNTHLRSGDVQHIRLGGIGANDHHIQFTSSMHSFPHPSALIADGAIISAKIAANAIGGPHILAESIPGGDLANQAITSAKIGTLAVGTPHLANLAVVSGKIDQSEIALALLGERAHGSLTDVTANQHHAEFTSGMHAGIAHPSALIANGAIISAKIPANAIGGGHILDGSIGGADLANQAVTSAKIGALAVGTPHIAANAIVSGKVASGGLPPLTSGKIWAGFTGNMPREEDKPVAATESWLHTELLEDEIIITERATVADFQTNPATGTFEEYTERVNDNNTATFTYSGTINQYAEVEFDKPVLIKRWRHYGHDANNNDGTWKIQYHDLVSDSWQDWVTGIATRGASWSSYATETLKLTTKIRLVNTAVDSSGYSYIGELEVIH